MFSKLLTKVNLAMAKIEYDQVVSTLPADIQKVVKDADFKRDYPEEYEKFHFTMDHYQENNHGETH